MKAIFVLSGVFFDAGNHKGVRYAGHTVELIQTTPLFQNMSDRSKLEEANWHEAIGFNQPGQIRITGLTLEQAQSYMNEPQAEYLVTIQPLN